MKEQNKETETKPCAIPSIGSSVVSVKIRICDLNIWGSKPMYQISTEVYKGNMSFSEHKWNKSRKRSCKSKAEKIFDKWKNELNKENVNYWIQ